MTSKTNDKHLITFDDLPSSVKERIIQNGKDAFREVLKEQLANSEKLPLIEWSEKYRVLPQDAAESGKLDFDRTPYMRDIARALDSIDPSEQIVVVKKGAQLGFTELAVSLIGKTIHQSPTNIMLIQETEDKSRKTVKNRIMPMLRRREFRGAIEDISGHGKGKGQVNQKEISFVGGMLTIWGSHSASSYSSTSAAVIILDEYARYPKNVQKEGDPLSLAKARMATYGIRGKLYVPSTPVEADESEGSFEAIYGMGDCKEYFMPCPHCGDYDYFRRDRFKDGEINGEVYGYMVCKAEDCGGVIEELEHKQTMIDKGEWRSTKERDSYNVTSYHVSGLLAPSGWMSWKGIAQDLVNAKRGKIAMRPIINTAFGDSYSEELDIPETPHILAEHTTEREIGVVPDDVAFLTMAADIQRGWIAYEVKGWCEREFSYSIEQGTIETDLSTDKGAITLRNLIRRKWAKESGARFDIEVVTVDSGDGQSTNDVYNFASHFNQPELTNRGWRIMNPRTVVAVKGSNKLDPTQIIERVTKIKKGAAQSRQINLWFIGTAIPKIQLYKALACCKTDDNHNMVDYPAAYSKEWFNELTAEQVVEVTDSKTGEKRIRFTKSKGRNEAIDLHVYNRAAAEIYGISQLTKKRFQFLRNRGKEQTEVGHDPNAPMPRPKRKRKDRDILPLE